MAGVTPPGDVLQVLRDEINDLWTAIRKLQRPTGTSVNSLVGQVQAALTNIGTTITTFLATGFTTGSMVATGGVTSASVSTTTLLAAAAPTTVHTGTRVAAWWLSANGLAGTATSSRRFKQDITSVLDDPKFDPLAVLELQMRYWHYIAEVRKRDDPTFEQYVGPRYKVAVNFSPIAEEAHELGLWMIVVYEREYVPGKEPEFNDDGEMVHDGVERLKLDDQGQPIPFALHDSLFGYLLQLAVKRMRDEQLRDRQLLHAIAEKVGIEPV